MDRGIFNQFVFCLRRDGTEFEEVPLETLGDWHEALFPSGSGLPPPGVWASIPAELLPEGAAVAYFNASGYVGAIFDLLPPFKVGDRVGLRAVRGVTGYVLDANLNRQGIVSVRLDDGRTLNARARSFDRFGTRHMITPHWREEKCRI